MAIGQTANQPTFGGFDMVATARTAAARPTELQQLRETVFQLRQLDETNSRIIAELRRDLDGMTKAKREAEEQADAFDEAAEALLRGMGYGPNSAIADPALAALAAVLWGDA